MKSKHCIPQTHLLLGVALRLGALTCVFLPSGGLAQQIVTEPLRTFGYGRLDGMVVCSDGKHFVTGGDHGAFLWDLESGKVIRHFDGSTGCLDISPDGSRLLTGDYREDVRLWDVATGEQLRTFPGAHTWSLAVSPDGSKLLIGKSEEPARMWNAATGELLQTFDDVPLDGGEAGALCVAFSPDGTRVLTGLNWTKARLWDAQSGSVLRTFDLPETCSGIAFSPDGSRILVGVSYAGAQLWDVTNGQLLRTFSGAYHSLVGRRAFSPSGATVLVSDDQGGDVTLWNVSSGLPLRTFHGRDGQFSAAGTQVFTRSRDEDAIYLYDVNTGQEMRTFEGHCSSPRLIAFTPDGSQFLVLDYGQWAINLWDANTGDALPALRRSRQLLDNGALSPDGTKFLTTGYLENLQWSVTLWDVPNRSRVWTIPVAWTEYYCAAFSPSGEFALLGGYNGITDLWNLQTGQKLHTFEGLPGKQVHELAYSPDGTIACTANRWQSDTATVFRWDMETYQLQDTILLEGHLERINSLVFSQDLTKALTGSDDKTARLWDLSDGHLLQTFTAEEAEEVYRVALSADGTRVLTGEGGGTARLWDATTGELLMIIRAGDIGSVLFSPDGTTVLTTSDGIVELWNLGVGPELHINRDSPSSIVLSWEPVAGSPGHILQQCNDLSAGEWTDVSVTEPGHYEVTNPVGTMLYRLKQP